MKKECLLIEKLKMGTITDFEFEQLTDSLNCVVKEKNNFNELRGMTVKYGAYYVVFINGNLSEETRNKTLAHELYHLLQEDLTNKDCSYHIKETKANKYVNK